MEALAPGVEAEEESNGMADILHQFKVKAPPQRVFDAFCIASELNNWWTARAEGEPNPEALYTLWFGPEYDWRARVSLVVPGKAITWTMEQAMDDWMGTTVGITLQEEPDGTVVDFFHRGWRTANDHYRISNYCWGNLLTGLKNYIEKGIVVPFNDRN